MIAEESAPPLNNVAHPLGIFPPVPACGWFDLWVYSEYIPSIFPLTSCDWALVWALVQIPPYGLEGGGPGDLGQCR
eukprot:5816406-Pyramimonas_sp.AAC.1